MLDFANTKALDPRVTFSRPTTATYYDNHTTVVAEQNLVLQSQTFDNASWVKDNATVTANSTTAPDGTTTADTFTPTVTNGYHDIYQAGFSNSAITGVFSIYVKANGYNYIRLWNGASASYSADFNLSTGTVIATGGSASNATITSVGSSWYRISVTTAINTYFYVHILNPADQTYSTFAGDGTSGVYLWGAQLEQRSSVTAYTPTTTTAITNYIPVLLTGQSNEARFDHNPTTRESLGLLIEEQRTNLLVRSEDFSNASWASISTGTPVVTSNVLVAPDGTITGDLVVGNNTNTWIGQNIGAVSAGQYTFSVWLKSNIAQTADIFLSYGANDILTCSVTTTWQRFTLTATRAATAGLYGGVNVGNGKNIYIWGAQLEAGSFSTSYIPTVASQVTRSADNATMTGTNFSSWYQASQGSFYAEVAMNYSTPPSGMYILYLVGSTSTNYVMYASTDTFVKNYDGATSSAFNLLNYSLSNKIMSTYSSSTKQIVANGGTPVSSSYNVSWANSTALNIGNNSGSGYMNGRIKKIAYYPIAVTSAQTQSLTG